MQNLPWFIRNEIIDIIVSYRRELCLVNKEWFTYTAGRFMNLKSKMILNDKRPSDWLKLTERLQLNFFSDLNEDFLTQCHKIKRVDFKFQEEISEIPTWFIQLLQNSPLETVYLGSGFDCTENDFQPFLEAISSQVKYLYLETAQGFDHDIFFEIKYQNLVSLEVKEEDSIEFSLICPSMPSLESLKIKTNSIDLTLSSPDNPTFNRLKRLQIESCIDDSYYSNFQVFELFQFNFPVLKIFQLKYYLEVFDLTKISNSMPNLETLHIESTAPRSISKFPVISLPKLKELRLCFEDVSENTLELETNNFPQLRHLIINYEFVFAKPNKENWSKITKLECYTITKFPLSNIRKYLTNLNVLIVDCNYLENKIHDILQLSDRITELTLLNVNQKVLPSSLPRGPFKITHLNLKGHKLYNTDFIDWVALNFQLSSFTLEFRSYKNIQIDVKQFSKLDHFNLNLVPSIAKNNDPFGEQASSDSDSNSDDDSDNEGCNVM